MFCIVLLKLEVKNDYILNFKLLLSLILQLLRLYYCKKFRTKLMLIKSFKIYVKAI